MKILIFGAGNMGQIYLEYIDKYGKTDDIVGFVDNNPALQGKMIKGREIFPPSEIKNMNFDKIIVTNQEPKQISEIVGQLKRLSIIDDKIMILMEEEELTINVLSKINRYDENTDLRIGWLGNFADYVYENHMAGSVAECGVYRGEFAYYINKYFKDKKLYLFDTFEGFHKKDVDTELAFNNYAFNNGSFAKYSKFNMTNEEIVKRRMLYPDSCIIKKGYFPESADGLEDIFCFVNLDMDLYQPMYSALKYFYKSMVPGGVILLHDYFRPDLPGVKKALEDFEKQLSGSICKIPIGDRCSMAIIKEAGKLQGDSDHEAVAV